MTRTDQLIPVRIPKQFLKHGQYYAGHCRNARVARWDANLQRFLHWRHKFGGCFIDEIKAFEDADEREDVFIPISDITNDYGKEIPIEARGDTDHTPVRHSTD